MTKYAVGAANGKIGELLVELQLTAQGWHVERLDGSSQAANGDLVALKGRRKVVIQVRTNGTQANRAFLGRAGGYLKEKSSFFNSKDAAILTDVVVSVTGGIDAPRFFVFSVDEAENLARSIADEWFVTPTKKGSERSPHFPISPMVGSLTDYEGRWDKLENF